MNELKINKTLKLWNDASCNAQQFITDDNKNVLFERYMFVKDFEHLGAQIAITQWSKWSKTKPGERLQNAYFVKNLSVDDIILERYEGC